MKELIKKAKKNRLLKRTVGLLTAFIMLFSSIYVYENTGDGEKKSPFVLKVKAAEVPTFEYTTDTDGNHNITIFPSQLVDYSVDCQKCPVYHQYDKILITTSGNESMQAFNYGFKGLGTSGNPFAGSIEIGANNEAITLNLDAPLFNYVYDDVQLINNGQSFRIARAFDVDRTEISGANSSLPLIASNIMCSANPGATWNIEVVSPTAGEDTSLRNFGGFIGNMESGAAITINLTMNTTTDDTGDITVVGTADSDIGIICGSMGENASLNFTLTADRKVASVTTAYGYAGGLVGSMMSGSVLNYTGTNIQNNSTDIKTTASEKYAGGLVGYNEGGCVKITLPSGVTSYPVGQYIEGTAGAGGLYGYLKPGATDTEDNDINSVNAGTDVADYSVNCQVNGTGYVGGLFGVLESEHDYSITGAETVTSSHASGSATGYGGLIGRYNNINSLSDTLLISSVTASPTRTGSATYFGGMIAAVADSIESGSTSGGSAYVKFDGTTASVNGADTMTFGGLVSKADNAFIDANNVTVSVGGEQKIQGGAVVGSLESGVLRMTGYTDVSSTLANAGSYSAGQIVGYRDNALIFGCVSEDANNQNVDWKLKRNSTGVAIDDIGSWGEIVRFSAMDNTTTAGSTGYGFGSDATVITVDEENHYVTIEAPVFDEDDSSLVTVGSASDFAKAALNIQVEGNDAVIVRADSNDFSSANIKLSADVDCTGTGISSFTRDNASSDSIDADKCVYTGIFDGDGHKVTLAIGEPYGYRIDTSGEEPVDALITDYSAEGCGKIYYHKYNGLFGIINSSSGDDDGNTVKNVSFDGKIYVSAQDHVANANNEPLYVGALAGQAAGTIGITNVNLTDTDTNAVHSSEFKIGGAEVTYAGGIIGKVASSVSAFVINDCDIACNIDSSNSSADSCYGGVIGWIAYAGTTADWDFKDITISGSITKTANHMTNKIGGLVAAISGCTGTSSREMELTDITVSGLSVTAKGSTAGDKDSSVGGVLGYSWINVNPTFHNVVVDDGSSVTLTDTKSKKGDLAGLVYLGTGHWIVETSSVTETNEETGDENTDYYYGIKIIDLTVTSSNARSFGMIVNDGWNTTSAIYLEIKADNTIKGTKSYYIAPAITTGNKLSGLDSTCIFDEIVAYSAEDGKVLNNSQGVISIETGLVTDGTNSSKTYQAQTARGAVPNDKSRYYYDLASIVNLNTDKANLMRWALDLYAHSSIRDYFNGPGWTTRDSSGNVTTVNIPNGTYNLENYSWYPVNMAGNITVNGTFKFYNDEFEDSEARKGGTYSYARTSLYDTTNDKATQHHLMHCGLLLNVTGGITIGTSGISLQGNVGRYGKTNSKESGALVCGIIKGGSTSSIATFTTNGNINLSGIYVHDHGSSTYAPLLINKIGEFSTIVIKNVKAESGKYTNNFKAASSLIGDVGSSGATNISLTFDDIQIDGRTTSGAYSLDSVYNTKSSLFYRATLLNTLRYSSGSAIYDFNIGDDWVASGNTYTRTGANGVTYGSEIDDNNSQHLGKEYWYKDTNGGIYTNYNTPGASGTGAPSPAISYAGFLPYVYDKCTAAAIGTAEDKKYQIKVNWADTFMTGCGTYNDPYILTSATDFDKIALFLSGTADSIVLPNVYENNTNTDPTLLKQKKWDNYGHSNFTVSGDNLVNDAGQTYPRTVVQNYLAGAYYKIEENTNIVLNSGFKGFGNTTEEQAIFRGVIVGTGETITLTGNMPLIYASNGSVVKGINIVVNNSSTINLNLSSAQKVSNGHKPNTNAKTYGAVMGSILGGDNIIDNVSVNFGNTKIKITNDSDVNKSSIFVGGYVGIVEKGSLIFRGMEGYRSTPEKWASIGGLKENTVIDASNNSCLYTIDSNENKVENLKWLYVNPIVGRVINGAVFTEGSYYRPFENGTRDGENPDNTQYEHFDEDVTMKNGTKNYSIADITPSLPMFTTDVPERTSNWTGTEDFRRFLRVNIGIPNAQSLYVMSLVTQAGLGAENYLQRSKRGTKETSNTNYYPANYSLPVGGYYNTGSWGIAPYFRFRSTHVAEYTYVGKCGGGRIPEPTEDKAWYEDYNKAKTDNAQYNRTGSTASGDVTERAMAVDVIPYIIGKYTPKIPRVTSDRTPNAFDSNYFNNIKNKELGYVAFCITHQYTYMNITLTGDGTTYYLPDGYRGLGALGYKNINNSDSQFPEVYQDLIVHLYGFDGGGNTVSLNMQYYCYNTSNDPYMMTGNNIQYVHSVGFGFIDAMMQNKKVADANIDPEDEKYQIRDFTITGSVKSDVINQSTGNVLIYNSNVNTNNFWAVGGLAGNIAYWSSANSGDDIFKTSIADINLSNLTVNGVRYTGGLMGRNTSKNNADSITTIKNITTSDLGVSSGLYTGGLIGYSTDTALDISNVTIAEPNIKSCLSFTSATKIDANATGGIVGYAATGTDNGPVYLHDITLGMESPVNGYSAYIGYNVPATYPTSIDYESVRVGGLIGQTASNSSTMISNGDIVYNTKIEKCNIYNVDINGHYTGGVIGIADASTITIGVMDTTVKNTKDNTILGHRINHASRGTGGIAGYIKAGNFVVNNCLVEGYTIKSTQRTGGIVGYTQATKTEIDNAEIKGVSFVSNAGVGGLVGYLDNLLNGYNIRTDNINFVCYSSSGSYGTGNNPTSNTRGHIIGFNNNKVIKLVGFSRNNLKTNVDCGSERMVGNYSDTNTPYRSGGYVIFADYYNTYSGTSKMSTVASAVNNTDNVTESAYKIDDQTTATNSFPYVNVSPKCAIESGENGRFLTGDAIISLTYNASVYKKILDDKASYKIGCYSNYKTTSLTSPSTATALDDNLSSVVSSQFSTAAAQVPGSGAPNIPLLVIENTDYRAVTQMLNTYINVLANTSGYNYAADYNADNTNTKYRISLRKCTYDKNARTYTIGDEGSACLKKSELGGQWYFRMTPNNVDNATDGVFQFSLLDVQFLNPSDSSEVAYHLYVPVYVRKLLQYDFRAAVLSGTDYYTGAYVDSTETALNGNSLFENLGNPVTLKFEYIYSRTESEWFDAINSGENVLTNLYKSISVEGGAWPVGTKMVLVDANNNDKLYYLDSPVEASRFSLYDFTDQGGNHYKPAPLQNLMTVTIGQPSDTSKRVLTPVALDESLTTESEKLAAALQAGATVRDSSGTYYRPLTDSAEDAALADTVKYAVTGVSGIRNERYYLSIFTPDSADTSIYHYQFTGPNSLPQRSAEDSYDGYRPNHLNKNNAVVHLYIGDIYENTFTMSVASKTNEAEMSKNNNYLQVNMNSVIRLKSVATEIDDENPNSAAYDKTRKGIAQNMRSNASTSEIYQAFLSTYDKIDTVGGSSNLSINMQTPPFVDVKRYVYYNGTGTTGTANPLAYTDPNGNMTENYIHLINNKNIISDLGSAANDYAITFDLEYTLNYFDETDLPYQFSLNPERVDGVGTKVIGYSNISSSISSLAYTATSKKYDTAGLRYYVTDASQASLNYNVVKTTGEMLGPYSDLGINPLDVVEKEHEIHTVAQYDTHSLKNSGDYIEFSLKLSKKDDYSANLPIYTYFKDLEIKGINNDNLYKETMLNGYIKSFNGVQYLKVTVTDTEVKFRVHKDYVQEQGGEGSGRYMFPITYTVYTGDEKFNNDGLQYSNYKVSVHAEMWTSLTGGTESDPSNADSELIYTNAKVNPEVID